MSAFEKCHDGEGPCGGWKKKKSEWMAVENYHCPPGFGAIHYGPVAQSTATTDVGGNFNIHPVLLRYDDAPKYLWPSEALCIYVCASVL